jgi:hypothetical protein
LTTTYKDVVIDDEVHEVVDKKNVMLRKTVELKDITSVQEVLNERGKPYKTRCMVHIHGEGHMIVKHKYEFIKELKHGESRIGY